MNVYYFQYSIYSTFNVTTNNYEKNIYSTSCSFLRAMFFWKLIQVFQSHTFTSCNIFYDDYSILEIISEISITAYRSVILVRVCVFRMALTIIVIWIMSCVRVMMVCFCVCVFVCVSVYVLDWLACHRAGSRCCFSDAAGLGAPQHSLCTDKQRLHGMLNIAWSIILESVPSTLLSPS